jgi:Peptidase family M1 domain
MTSFFRVIAAAVATAMGAPALLFAQTTGGGAPSAAPHMTLFDTTGVGDTSVFAPLGLPPGNEFRSASGAPGAHYWQNHADYDIRATLDTTANTLTADLHLRYTNHSPDTLRFVWFQVEQNAFAPNSLNSLVFPEQSRFGGRGFNGGDMIDHFDLVREGGKAGSGSRVALHTMTEGTELKADLPEPLAPGATAVFDIAWHFEVPEHGADRMGRDGSLYEMAQWYPRVAVYDDLKGWNTEPYLGQGEFYLEYGDFTYAVTLPAGYIIGGTGVLDNPREVLTEAERTRLAKAAATPGTQVAIVTDSDLARGVARPRTTGTLTWHFHAHNVRDVAWAAAPDYLWDAESWHGIMAYAYYRPSAEAVWHDAADMGRMSIEEYSTRWYPYPYPQVTAVEGPVSGMEYPMLAMESRNSDKYELYSVVTHEIGHNWFPMIVGSNERVHMWQDEGLNTFINMFSEARRFPERGDEMGRAAEDRAIEEKAESLGVDIPIEIQADRVPPQLLALNSYTKPSVGLQLLRQEILGPEAFDDAFRAYIRRWAYKHPSPADFFRTMSDVSGQQLGWFWREFWLENYHFDQAIDTVVTQQRADTERVIVVYGNRARGVLPILARFTFSDGSSESYDYPALVWSMNTTRYVRHYLFAGKRLTRVELDPDHRLIDIDRNNNVWTAPPAS